MPRKYVRKYSENPRVSWTEETLRQAIARINAGEIGIREAERYYGIPEATLLGRKNPGTYPNNRLVQQVRFKGFSSFFFLRFWWRVDSLYYNHY
jgi:hypothetical protein